MGTIPSPRIYGGLLLEAAGHPIGGTAEQVEAGQQLAVAMFQSMQTKDQRAVKDHFSGDRELDESALAKYIYLAKWWFELSTAGWSFEEIEAIFQVLPRLTKEQRETCVKYWLKKEKSPIVPDVLSTARSIESSEKESTKKMAKKREETGQCTLAFFPDYLTGWALDLYQSWSGPRQFYILDGRKVERLALARDLITLINKECEGFTPCGEFSMPPLAGFFQRVAEARFPNETVDFRSKVVGFMRETFSVNILARTGNRSASDERRTARFALSPLGRYIFEEARRTGRLAV